MSLSVAWFGGEQLLAADVIESLSKRLMAPAEEKGVDYRASIITNAYLLTQDVIDMLSAVKVTSAQVTIDGLCDDARHRVSGRQ